MCVFLLSNACHVIGPHVDFISVSWCNEINVVKSIRSLRIVLKNLVLSVRMFFLQGKESPTQMIWNNKDVYLSAHVTRGMVGFRVSSAWWVWLCLGQIPSAGPSLGSLCNSQAASLVLTKRHSSILGSTPIIREREMYQPGMCSAEEKERNRGRGWEREKEAKNEPHSSSGLDGSISLVLSLGQCNHPFWTQALCIFLLPQPQCIGLCPHVCYLMVSTWLLGL